MVIFNGHISDRMLGNGLKLHQGMFLVLGTVEQQALEGLPRKVVEKGF